ncbi:MAG: aminopeptidase P N-terminal domain-containing protein [Pseudomonadota bacterium]|nr:aminopeptidase P N-terminal domain-containing protein [Pseudomonadota bacterium]
MQLSQQSSADLAVFAQRRARLMAMMGDSSLALIPTSQVKIRNADADYAFRADSSFFYLTGFAEPEAVAVLAPSSDAPYQLFCRERDPAKEIWDGRRAGTQGAVERFGADQAYPIAELDTWLPKLMTGKKRLYVRLGQDPQFDQQVSGWLKQVAVMQRHGGKVPFEIIQLDHLIDEMRLIKDETELMWMRQAAQISAAAHVRAMQTVRVGMPEYALEAELLYVLQQHGCKTAYNSIVGGGQNACILHYVENNQPLRANDLVLIDAGAELNHYAADITRTFPVNGRFTAPQKALYQVVLDAQLAAIAMVRVGQHCKAYHEVAVRELTAGLLRLGLLQGELQDLIESGAYRRFYMHGTGHWLGLDVHDVGSYKDDAGEQWRPLQAGMVLTVEPGLYVAVDDDTVDPQWRGIGIRIEDDVLVTEGEPEVLTSAVPKTIAEIEQLMQGSIS